MTVTDLGKALFIFCVSVGITWVVRAAAYRYNFVSAPRDERWHQRPTALFGGIAFVVSFMVGLLLFVPLEHDILLLAACSGGMFVLGLVDDFLQIKPQTKLIGQIVISITLIYFGPSLKFFESAILNLLITLFWLVGITNAMNLLDNMDGLCAGIAIIAAVYRLVFCLLEGHTAGALLALVFVAAISGFLTFNFNPASLFMGDCGSLFIGFMLAGMNISDSHTYAKSILSVLLFPVLLLIIPIFDTTLVTVGRKIYGRRVSMGGRDHSSHRLVAIGLSERQAVLVLYAMAVSSGGIAYVLYQRGFSYAVFFMGLFLIGVVLFGVYLSRVKIYGDDAVCPIDEKSMVRLVVNIPYKKQLFAVILDFVLILTAYYGAYRLRFGPIQPGDVQFRLFLESFPILIVLSFVSFFVFGLYRYSWRYTGIQDLWVMMKGCFGGTMCTVLALTYFFRFEGYSRSVFLIYWGSLVMLVAGSRLSFSMLTELFGSRPEHHRKVLIYGAGDGGELLLRELKNNYAREAVVVGFLDDDPNHLKTRIHGVPVLGGVETTEFWVRRYLVSQIIISSGKIPSKRVAQLQEVCDRFQIDLQRASMKFEKAAYH